MNHPNRSAQAGPLVCAITKQTHKVLVFAVAALLLTVGAACSAGPDLDSATSGRANSGSEASSDRSADGAPGPSGAVSPERAGDQREQADTSGASGRGSGAADADSPRPSDTVGSESDPDDEGSAAQARSPGATDAVGSTNPEDPADSTAAMGSGASTDSSSPGDRAGPDAATSGDTPGATASSSADQDSASRQTGDDGTGATDPGDDSDGLSTSRRPGAEAPTPGGSGRAPTDDPPPVEIPAAVEIPGVTHVWQKWNNCGPSSVLMALSAHGIALDQLDVAAVLKPNRNDTNVSPGELAGFARQQGQAAVVRYGIDHEAIKRLTALGLPVIVEHWVDVEGRGAMGHYRVVIGYNDETGHYVVRDSYFGPRRTYGYAELEAMSKPFAGAHVVIYPPDMEAAVRSVMGRAWDAETNVEDQRQRLEAAVEAQPGDPWLWFGLGEMRSKQGDHQAAVEAYRRAIDIGLPFRTFWYQFGYYESLVALGRYDEALARANETLASLNGENLEENHYWRGRALEGLGRTDEARAAYERAIHFNPTFAAPREALDRLE